MTLYDIKRRIERDVYDRPLAAILTIIVNTIGNRLVTAQGLVLEAEARAQAVVDRMEEDAACAEAQRARDALATFDAKDAEIARLRKRMNEDGDAITQAVLAEIRDILNAGGVPEATWVDDHVRNAVTEIARLREDLTATKENRDLYLRQAQWREEDMRVAEAHATAAEARLAEVVQLIREMSHERYNGGNSAPEMVRWDTCLDRLEVFAAKGGSDA